MLSLFPELLDFQFLAIGVLRIALGIIFILFGYVKLFSQPEATTAFFEKARLWPAHAWAISIGVLELLGGVLLLIGLFTQIAALILAILMLGAVILKLHNHPDLKNDVTYYILLFLLSFALLFLGPGAFAYDLSL